MEHSLIDEKIRKAIDKTEPNLIDLEQELSDSYSQSGFESSEILNMTDLTLENADINSEMRLKSRETVSLSNEIYKSIAKNIVKRPVGRMKKKLEFASF